MNYPAEINAILAQIISDLPNDSQITAEELRGVLTPLTTGIYDALAAPDDVVLAQFPAYDPGQEYEGGNQVVVKHNGQLWVFISGTDKTGVAPGTNALVWTAFSLLALAHGRNQDDWLDQNGSFAVSAQQVREHLEDETIHQVPPVQLLDETMTVNQIENSFTAPVELLPDPPDGFFRDFIDLKAVQVPVDENPLEAYDAVPANQTAVITTDENTNLLTIDLSDTVYVQRSVTTRWTTFTANAAILFKGTIGNPSGGNFKIRILGHYRLIPITNE